MAVVVHTLEELSFQTEALAVTALLCGHRIRRDLVQQLLDLHHRGAPAAQMGNEGAVLRLDGVPVENFVHLGLL